MAEALVQVLIENLSSLIQKEMGSIMGVDKEMKKLQSTLTTIQSVLEDAEAQQLQSKPIQNWLSKLNDTAFEIEDILDECATEVSRSERRGSKFNLKKVLFSRKMGRRMKEMGERLDDLAAERRNFHLREVVVPPSTVVDCRGETGFILNDPDHVYGREEDEEKIVDLLVNEVAEREQLSVLPIIGVGGLGKTTLAQLIFNDERVSHHFDTKIWVCVSDNFDVKLLLKAILEFAKGSSTDLVHVAALQHRIREVLNQKRFLLVLDDVWNENQESWVMLQSVLECGFKGSSAVVTTRLQNVADIMGTLPAHCLKGLSEEHCWLLFRSRAFGHESKEQPRLENMGRQIVKKCAGVPLAALALGGLLRFKREESEWIRVEKSELWNLQDEDTIILPALRLSYHHLSSALRRCFVYCATFQKGSRIEKQDLIFCWMAHGYIFSNEIQDVEDVGDQIWNELVLRSFFQEVNTRGRRTTFKMHDLIHDLAQSIMEKRVSNSVHASNNRVRELYFSEYSMHSCSSIMLKVATLTSVMNYTRLRILKLNRARADKLPNAIGKLKYLRYLDLTSSHIHTLPGTLCSLRNLQILILNDCHLLETLPKNIRYMTNLRHIFIPGCYMLSDMPSGIGELTFLKTLSLFVVGQKVGNQLDQLQLLNLGGRLEIRRLERAKDHISAKKANLVEKPNLRDLVLSWEHGMDLEESAKVVHEKVLEALEPHSDLETLEISGFKGSCFPMWVTKMKNLGHISIQNCQNCWHLPLGDLPCLKSLYLQCLDGLENIVNENETGNKIFPSLEKLRLVHLPNLKELVAKEAVQGEIMFPKLEGLYIQECELLKLPAALSKLERLTIQKCSTLTISSFSEAKLENLTYLHLEFGESNATACIPEGAWEGLYRLRKLRIWNAGEQHLPKKWYQCLKSLRYLETRYCKIGGSCRWLQHLTGLEKLWIQDCSEMEEQLEDIKHLHALKHLALLDLNDMVSLPHGLQHVSSLHTLTLGGLCLLSSLPEWFANLASLTYFKIHSCPIITSLPPMPSLTYLGIGNCPHLQRRCHKGRGEDWPNIAHIPQLDIFN